MQLIPEATIDAVLNRFDPADEDDYDAILANHQGQQPGIFSYLTADSFDILTDDEKTYLIYLALVILESINAHQKPELVKPEALEAADERNWELWSEAKGKRFRDRLDVFFNDNLQEDLLAFVEDSIEIDDNEEEEWRLTAEGREPLFIGLKTVIDCLLPARRQTDQ